MGSLVALALLATVATATGIGNPWVDRPGGDFIVVKFNTSVGTDKVTAECAERCSDAPCRAWAVWRTKEGSECRLKDVIPEQWDARKERNFVASGTRLYSFRPMQYQRFAIPSLAPEGWLLRQLQLQEKGLSGHLDMFWEDVQQSVWVGGTHDSLGAGHERGPYWLNGVVPLSSLLNASGVPSAVLGAEVLYWIEYIIDHQLSDGWLGPDDGYGGKGNTYWSGWNTAVALLQYAEGTARERCLTAVRRYVECTYQRMLTTPFATWSKVRWQDWAFIVQLLADATGPSQILWDAAELARVQGFDWDSYYNRTGGEQFPLNSVPTCPHYHHGVNNAMGTKSGAVAFRMTSNPSDAQVSYTKLAKQDRYHGQPQGTFAADECFAGRHLNRATELCTVVEQMYSLAAIFHIQGGVAFLDRFERLAFNALPATITPDMWQHQYLQQANEVNALYGLSRHVWQTDGGDATGFGVEPNFGCCTANMNQGWPKTALNAFFTYNAGEGVTGIAIGLFLPIRGVVNGSTVRIVTTYPFGDDVNVTLAVPHTASGSVPLRIRIPSWADQAVLLVDGVPQKAPNGTMVTVSRRCAPGGVLRVVLQLNPSIRVEKGWGAHPTNAAAVVRGPLVYALKLVERFSTVRKWSPFGNVDSDITTPSDWNYVLDLSQGLQFTRAGDPGAAPFNTSGYPVVIHAKGRKLAEWKEIEGYSAAAEPPPSPILCTSETCGEAVDLLLVPFGATNIRMAGMPWMCHGSTSQCACTPPDVDAANPRLAITETTEFLFLGGASIVPNGDEYNLRSGNPGEVNVVEAEMLVMDCSKPLRRVSFSYQYMSGYGPDGKHQGGNFTVALVDQLAGSVINVYSSPELTGYPYDVCSNCYSPPVNVSAALNTALPPSHPAKLRVTFRNNDRNVILRLPLHLAFFWG